MKLDNKASKLMQAPTTPESWVVHLNPKAILAMAPREPQVRKASSSASAKSVKRKSETPRFQWTLLSISRSTWAQLRAESCGLRLYLSVQFFSAAHLQHLDHPRLIQRPTFVESSKSSVKNEPQFKQQLKPTRLASLHQTSN